MEQPSTSVGPSKKSTYKYCIVPKCKNTIRNAPDKLFFLVPRGVDIRKKWCKIMKRDMLSPTTCLYCCEDHFDVEGDTSNYMQYKFMNLQEKQKTTLRLKKGILPHKFNCQEDNKLQPPPVRKGFLKRKHLEIVEASLSVPPAQQSVTGGDSSSENDLEVGTSWFSPQACIQDSKVKHECEASCSTSVSRAYRKNEMHVDKAIQVNSKTYNRSKSTSVDVCAKTKSTAISLIPASPITTSTSPLTLAQVPDINKKLFQDNDNLPSISSSQSSLLSSPSLELDTSSSESSWNVEDDSEKETPFKNQMCSCMLTAIEKEPKMLLGLPKRSYYLIKLLSENIPLPTIDILITLKKIKLNESFSILALQFGYTHSTISRIFSKSVPLLAEKIKSLILWLTPSEIFNSFPTSNIVSIIDCLEIQIEKPSNAVHQSLTWSQYKKCYTLKYLISCTSDGLVNFISNGYGGRTTDVMIVTDCGLLECLNSKTVVVADKGFKDLSHLLAKKDCSLIRPMSVYKSSPNTKENIKESKRIAALRLQIECVINRLREFNMLLPHACVDYNLIPVMDDIIAVSCGLINMQDGVINK